MGLVLCIQDAFFLFVVARSAANVVDEAEAGLEVVRRKTMLGRRTDEELFFNFSMYYSYTAYKGCVLRGGGEELLTNCNRNTANRNLCLLSPVLQ